MLLRCVAQRALSAAPLLQEVKVLQEETTQEENRYNEITSMTEASWKHSDQKSDLLLFLSHEVIPSLWSNRLSRCSSSEQQMR